MKKRIWELDLLRGLNLFVMMAIHFIYDITNLFVLVQWRLPAWYDMVVRLCGSLFVLISGICVTLGKHSVKRGLTVLGGGMIITAVTVALALSGLCGWDIIIYFGVLHCLGCCMLLWPLFRKCPGWVLCLIGLALMLLGRYLDTLTTDSIWLIPLGVVTPTFCSSDYFPLIRHFGTFLCGAGIARYLYPEKTSLFPNANEEHPLIRFFSFCGRHSLVIYLVHQPILAAIAAGLYFIF